MGKKSKSQDVSVAEDAETTIGGESAVSYDEKLHFVNAISKPMATKSQAKKLYKLIKKASKEKTFLRAGLKDVQRRVRLGERGLCVIAGDVCPVDVICHMPGVCEEKKIPYCYTPSRSDLGAAMGVKRGLVILMVRPNDAYQDLYDQALEEIKTMEIPTA